MDIIIEALELGYKNSEWSHHKELFKNAKEEYSKSRSGLESYIDMVRPEHSDKQKLIKAIIEHVLVCEGYILNEQTVLDIINVVENRYSNRNSEKAPEKVIEIKQYAIRNKKRNDYYKLNRYMPDCYGNPQHSVNWVIKEAADTFPTYERASEFMRTRLCDYDFNGMEVVEYKDTKPEYWVIRTKKDLVKPTLYLSNHNLVATILDSYFKQFSTNIIKFTSFDSAEKVHHDSDSLCNFHTEVVSNIILERENTHT